MRPILTGILLLLTAAGTALAAQVLPRSYQSDASVVLLASRAVSKPNGGNPYLSFSPSLTLTAEILSQELMSPTTVSYLATQGLSAPYTVALAPYTTQTTGSALLIDVAGNDKVAVENTMHGVIDEIGAKLGRLQSGITPYNKVRMLTLSEPSQATLSVSQTARQFVLLLAFGLAASFGIPWLIDAQIVQRHARRREASHGPGGPAARDPVTAPYPAAAAVPGDDVLGPLRAAASAQRAAGYPRLARGGSRQRAAQRGRQRSVPDRRAGRK